MNIVPYLTAIYNIIEKSFGKTLNQHQYEGLVALLYESMSIRNIGKLLAYFTDKHEAIITADVDKCWNKDKSQYKDIEKQLNENGFAQWVSAFDFQVENSYVKDDVLYVEGRFVEGQKIHVGDKIYSVRTKDSIESVEMEVVSIETYRRQVEFIVLSMTALLGIKVITPCNLDINRGILSSESVVE